MFDRMKDFSQKIQLKLENKTYMAELKKHMRKSDEWVTYGFENDLAIAKRPPDDKTYSETLLKNAYELAKEVFFPYYLQLLAITCTYNMRQELNELLLAENLFKPGIHADINHLQRDLFYSARNLIDQPLTVCRSSGSHDTMLGIASFHGHLDLVKYLVEEKKADVNAMSIDKDTPLHKVVLGDSAPVNHSSYGIQHAQVAEYLIEHKADITARNKSARTPLEEARQAAPPLLSFIFSNSLRSQYCADVVRPVLERAQKRVAEKQPDLTQKTLTM